MDEHEKYNEENENGLINLVDNYGEIIVKAINQITGNDIEDAFTEKEEEDRFRR